MIQIIKIIYRRIDDFLFRLFWRGGDFVDLQGSKFFINPREQLFGTRKALQGYAMMTSYEPRTTELMKKFIKKGDTVLDIGASFGYFTLLMSRLVGDKGRVYSFEPIQKHFWYICENLKKNNYKNVSPHCVAVTDKEGIDQVFFTSEYKVWVNTISIDSFLQNKVDFVKIDIDGWELPAIRGMKETIKKNPNLKMIIEYYPKYLVRYGDENAPKELMAELKGLFNSIEKVGDYGGTYWNLICQNK